MVGTYFVLLVRISVGLDLQSSVQCRAVGGREREKLPLTKGVRYTLLTANTSHYISILAVCPVTLH